MIVHAYYLKDARVRRYADLLVRLGHSVDVICLRDSHENPYEKYKGVSIYRINESRTRGEKISYVNEYVSSFIKFFIKLNKLYFKGNRYDIIHIHNFPNFLVFSTVIQKLLGSKVILDIHDPMPELFQSKFRVSDNSLLNRILFLEEKISSSFVDAIITANHSFKDILVKRGCHAKKISVVLNMPDEKIFRKKSVKNFKKLNSKDFNVLYIGTLAERYGIKTVLEAVAKIRSEGTIPNIKIAIIPKLSNEGNYLSKLLEKVHEYKLEGHFSLLNPVPNDKMPDVINACDLSVYTPIPDVHMDIALSLKIPEVLAVGRPMLTSKLSVLKRYFGEEAIFMCEPGNVSDCAKKIVHIHNNPKEIQEKIIRAQKILNKIGWDKQKKIYIRLISQLFEGRFAKKEIPSKRMKLKRFLRRIVNNITYYSGLVKIWEFFVSKHTVRILTYHGIEKFPQNSYSVSLDNFKKQMGYLKKNYNIISLLQYSKGLIKKNSFPENTVVITFDDGLKNFYSEAYPILKKYNLPATCFLITSKLNKNYGNYMSWNEIEKISKDGIITIGSHSCSHRSLPSLNEFEQKNEIGGSKSILEDRLGLNINFFSYPWGTFRDFNEKTKRLLSKYNYKLAFTSINGVNFTRNNRFALRRTKIEWGDDLSTFKKIIRETLDIWIVVDYFFRFLQRRNEADL
ncbi:MAG: polysaccharide deacetylase family protein [Promethearchaeota archaeon]